ncbi:MAG: protein-ADP-ribose hydrolase [Clostridia bacterium]|nr:protein-ADP-ribose hydrolase [Clostridia bacterium]
MEKIDYLIEYLLKESGRKNFDYNNRDKKSLYRALVNVRQANPISEEFLKAEDKYLQEELEKQDITNVNDIKANNKIALWQGDITKLKIDAIVNAGNSQGLGCFLPNHNCIDNQINTFAGVRLRLACNEIMKDLNYNLETGKAIITKGYNLPCKYVIQTVGPIVENEVAEQKEKELKNCYINSLKLAVDNGIKTIAFPCISTGVFRFPKDRACKIAIESVKDFLKENDKIEKVVFNVYSDEDLEIYKNELK